MPRTTKLRVGSRGSALALIQTDLVVRALARVRDEPVATEVVTFQTAGDRDRVRSFEAIGPRGIFAHELQRALIDGEIDVAVHSLKDLPSTEPEGLTIVAVPPREDARDVLVSRAGRLEELPPGAVVGTSSARRTALLRTVRPDLRPVTFRGNVDTRLAKVERGEVAAAVLAAAGLDRLGRSGAVTQWLDPHTFVPAPGQGALAVEVASERASSDLAWVARIEDPSSRRAVDAERAFTAVMEGGCEVPLGAWAEVSGDTIDLIGFVADPETGECYRGSERGTDPDETGRTLAEQLLNQGAAALLERLRE